MTPLELIYYIGYFFDKRLKLKRQKRLPHKVISIGNITVGGTGKTPATIAVATEAKKRGLHPVILTRGYKGKAKGPCLVQYDAARAPELFGDEPALMSERLRDVPIIKCLDRYEGGMFFLGNYEPQAISSQPVFILDDGFQHWRLHRDVDIALISGSNPFGNRRLLPKGILREPIKELIRADCLVITKNDNPDLRDELREMNKDAVIHYADYRIRHVEDLEGNKFSIDFLRNLRVYAFCGIANPSSFEMGLSSVCGSVAEMTAYADHYQYTERDINLLCDRAKTMKCEYLICTEKDAVKIRGIKTSVKILYTSMDMEFQDDFFDIIFK